MFFCNFFGGWRRKIFCLIFLLFCCKYYVVSFRKKFTPVFQLPLEERSDEEEEGFDDFITFSSLDYLRICQESRNTYHKKLV